MKKLTFNNGIKNHALFGILGLVLNTSFCAHQNLNVKSLKNDLTHKAMAHLNHVSDQAGISSPGFLRCYFLGQMFRLRPFCVHRSFTTKNFSLGQFIWGVEGDLKQYHWANSLSFDPILHQSIFRLSVQANPLKKSFSKGLFLGAARMSDGHSDADFDDSIKMVDLVSTVADPSQISDEEKIRFLEERLKKSCEVFGQVERKLLQIKENSVMIDLDVQRFLEAASRKNLDTKSKRNAWVEYKELEREVSHKMRKIYEEVAIMGEEDKARLRLSMEILKELRESLEPGQEADIKQRIEGLLESLNQKIEVANSFPAKNIFQLLIDIGCFHEEVIEPICDIYHMVNKRLEQREDEELARKEKSLAMARYHTKNLKKSIEDAKNFLKNRKNKKEERLGSVGLEALLSNFKNC